MRNGHSLTEVVACLAVMSIVVAAGYSHLGSWFDRVAVERSRSEITMALGVARNAAVLRRTRARVVLEPDSLRIEEWDGAAWHPSASWVGPAQHGVSIVTSNKTVTFDALGLGWGTANTRVVLSRGLQSATITMSRVGRVKRW